MSITCINDVHYLVYPDSQEEIPNPIFKIFFDTVNALGSRHSSLKAAVIRQCHLEGAGDRERAINALFHLILDTRIQLAHNLNRDNTINLIEFDAAYDLLVMPYQLPHRDHPFFNTRRFLEHLDPSIRLIHSPLSSVALSFLENCYRENIPFDRLELHKKFRLLVESHTRMGYKFTDSLEVVFSTAISFTIKRILSYQIEANFPELRSETSIPSNELDEFVQKLVQSKLRQQEQTDPDQILTILRAPPLNPVFFNYSKAKIRKKIEQTQGSNRTI